jgi:transcription elongation factor/antiterminator RfaH
MLTRHRVDFELQPATRWYAVQTRPASERFAEENLRRQGYDTYLPQVRRTVRHARRQRDVLRPLFPRYLFVALDVETAGWRSVRGTFGVRSLVMEGERPLPVPRGLVERMIAVSDADGRIDLRCELAPGSPVKFLRGPFANRLGTLAARKDADRVAVLLEILGATREVEVDPADLLPA